MVFGGYEHTYDCMDHAFICKIKCLYLQSYVRTRFSAGMTINDDHLNDDFDLILDILMFLILRDSDGTIPYTTT